MTPVELPPESKQARHIKDAGIQKPEKLRHVPPEYPDFAKEQRIRGVVILEAEISEEGAVRSAKVLRASNPLLTRAAADAVQQWRYAPTLLNGVAIPVIMTVTVSFTLS